MARPRTSLISFGRSTLLGSDVKDEQILGAPPARSEVQGQCVAARPGERADDRIVEARSGSNVPNLRLLTDDGLAPTANREFERHVDRDGRGEARCNLAHAASSRA